MNKIAPVFIVEDVAATVRFYVEKLGFEIDFVGEPPRFSMLRRGEVTIMFRQLETAGSMRPNRIPQVAAGWQADAAFAWDAYIWVDDAEAVYQEFKENGVSIIREPQKTDYGNLDFDIEDANGFILCFGQVMGES